MTADAFLTGGRARLAFGLRSDTWNAVVLWALGEGPCRPVDLRERIGGISRGVLTEALRRPQFARPVARRSDSCARSRVEYELTATGRTLPAPIDAAGVWAFEHGDDVVAAREAAEVHF